MILTTLVAATLAATPPAAPPKLTVPAEALACDLDKGAGSSICRALAAQKAGRLADAAAEFEGAAASVGADDPRTSRLFAAAGNMWIAAGQPGKAAVALDRALAGKGLFAEQVGEALLDRARAAEAQGDLKTARAKLKLAAETIAADPFYWYFSAALAVREDDVPAAKLAIARALTLAPADPTILFEAGHVASLAGEESKARDYWTRAAAADPSGPSGTAARAALAMKDAPLTVTNQVAARPNGDGEGGNSPKN
jgi:tetratricopeptide (TPR) repeat protein